MLTSIALHLVGLVPLHFCLIFLLGLVVPGEVRREGSGLEGVVDKELLTSLDVPDGEDALDHAKVWVSKVVKDAVLPTVTEVAVQDIALERRCIQNNDTGRKKGLQQEMQYN